MNKDLGNKFFLDGKIKKREKAYLEELFNAHIGKKRNIIKLLGLLKEQGYVFHGSQDFFEEIVPQLAKSGKKIKAIYATVDPDTAVFYSITPNSAMRGKPFGWLKDKVGEKWRVSGIDTKISGGYIHVMKKKGFKKYRGNTYVSFKKNRPSAVIRTRKSDFPHKIGIATNKISDWESAKKVIIENYSYNAGNHDDSHVLRVAQNAEMLARENCPKFIADAIMGALLHDIGRTGDGNDNGMHAVHGSLIAKKILKEYFSQYDLDEKKIIYAIRYHADGGISDDPLIGTIWDADRLDLGRIGIKINPKFLSTKAAKNLAESYNLKNNTEPVDKKMWGGIVLVPGCQSNCLFCGKVARPPKVEMEKQEENVRRNLIDFKKQGIKNIEISGSDPIEYEKIIALVRHIKKMGFSLVQLSTHGKKFSDQVFLSRLVLAGLDKVRIPLHGPTAKIHDSVTRTPGSFNETLEGIKKLQKLAPQVGIQISFLIMQQNKNHLVTMANLAKKLKIIDFYFAAPCVSNNDFSYYVPFKDLGKYVKKVFAHCKKNKQEAFFMEIPPCVFGFGDSSINNKTAPPDLGKYCQPPGRYRTEIKDLPLYRLKKKMPLCAKCALQNECDGFFVNDVERFGVGKLKPII